MDKIPALPTHAQPSALAHFLPWKVVRLLLLLQTFPSPSPSDAGAKHWRLCLWHDQTQQQSQRLSLRAGPGGDGQRASREEGNSEETPSEIPRKACQGL